MRTHEITEWNPEDTQAWEAGNSAIARRNLIWLVANVHITYSIWYLWSVMVLFMPQSIYHLATSDKLLLEAVASLVGALVRVPYTMAANWFGGRTWTTWSSLILLIPTVLTAYILSHPGQPHWLYLTCAALTGLGGGNYSSSLAKVEGYYPQRLKGSILGLTGGIANLGSASIQAIGLFFLLTVGRHAAPYWVCGLYLVLLSIAGVGAAIFMDNNRAHRKGLSIANIRAVLPVSDTWLLSFLYMCASGSFLGFAFAFGQLLQHNFMASGQTYAQASLHASEIAFTGPLLGSLARIFGGRYSDRFGGGRVAMTVFLASVLGGVFMTAVGAYHDRVHGAHNAAPLATTLCFIFGFVALFIFAGAGKASVYKLIPTVFDVRSRSLGLGEDDRRDWARVRSAALIGLAGAFGALGSMGVNLILRQSYKAVGTETPAFAVFTVCYLIAAYIAWVRYVRPWREQTPDEASAKASAT